MWSLNPQYTCSVFKLTAILDLIQCYISVMEKNGKIKNVKIQNGTVKKNKVGILIHKSFINLISYHKDIFKICVKNY